MTREETKALLNKLFNYRPYFKNEFSDNEKGLQSLINDWYFTFQDYDYIDVIDSLNEFLQEDTSNAKIPNPHQLAKYLVKTKNKFQEGRIYSRCMFCNKILDYESELHKHEDRCRSIAYLKILYKKYIGREIDEATEEDLRNMNQYKFDDCYYKILEKVYNQISEGEEKEYLRKVLETK